MAVCERCSSSWHTKCLIGNGSLNEQSVGAGGDWYCKDCIEATDHLGRPFDVSVDTFGYDDGEDFLFDDFHDYAANWKAEYFGISRDEVDNIPWHTVEKNFWNAVSQFMNHCLNKLIH